MFERFEITRAFSFERGRTLRAPRESVGRVGSFKKLCGALFYVSSVSSASRVSSMFHISSVSTFLERFELFERLIFFLSSVSGASRFSSVSSLWRVPSVSSSLERFDRFDNFF